MKKIIAGLFAGLMLTMSAQALAAYNCEDGVCTLPERQDQSYCYGGSSYCGNDNGYCYGDRNTKTRGGCGCYRGR
jgi:iron-sulfur cluster-binding protein